jgi:hypothetical protein
MRRGSAATTSDVSMRIVSTNALPAVYREPADQHAGAIEQRFERDRAVAHLRIVGAAQLARHEQAQPGALRIAGEKRLEQAALLLARDFRAVVPDDQFGVVLVQRAPAGGSIPAGGCNSATRCRAGCPAPAAVAASKITGAAGRRSRGSRWR